MEEQEKNEEMQEEEEDGVNKERGEERATVLRLTRAVEEEEEEYGVNKKRDEEGAISTESDKSCRGGGGRGGGWCK